MKGSNIHRGLSSADVRDFLAKGVRNGYPGEVEHLEARIAVLKERLIDAKESQACRELIALNGWDYWDVSDDIDEFVAGEYFPFIGTKAEMFKQGLGSTCYREEGDGNA